MKPDPRGGQSDDPNPPPTFAENAEAAAAPNEKLPVGFADPLTPLRALCLMLVPVFVNPHNRVKIGGEVGIGLESTPPKTCHIYNKCRRPRLWQFGAIHHARRYKVRLSGG